MEATGWKISNVIMTLYLTIWYFFSELWDINSELLEISQNCEIKIRNYLFFYSVVETIIIFFTQNAEKKQSCELLRYKLAILIINYLVYV